MKPDKDQARLWDEVKLNIYWHDGGDDALSHQRALEKINGEAGRPKQPLAREELHFAIELWAVGLMHKTIEPHQQVEGARCEPKSESLRVVFLPHRRPQSSSGRSPHRQMAPRAATH